MTFPPKLKSKCMLNKASFLRNPGRMAFPQETRVASEGSAGGRDTDFKLFLPAAPKTMWKAFALSLKLLLSCASHTPPDPPPCPLFSPKSVHVIPSAPLLPQRLSLGGCSSPQLMLLPRRTPSSSPDNPMAIL